MNPNPYSKTINITDGNNTIWSVTTYTDGRYKISTKDFTKEFKSFEDLALFTDTLCGIVESDQFNL